MDNLLILDIIKIIATIANSDLKASDGLIAQPCKDKLPQNTQIARDGNVWYKLTLISDKFNEYSKSDVGICAFIEAHYTCEVGERHTYRKIFGVFHSFYDLPAKEMDEHKIWYYNGKIHRGDDKPAYTVDNEKYALIKQVKPKYYKAWYNHGVRHRDGLGAQSCNDKHSDKPAIICEDLGLLPGCSEYYHQMLISDSFSNEYESYYKNGKIHRDNEPALICKNGAVLWCVDGLIHRENGPAYINGDGVRRYFLNNVEQIGVHNGL